MTDDDWGADGLPPKRYKRKRPKMQPGVVYDISGKPAKPPIKPRVVPGSDDEPLETEATLLEADLYQEVQRQRVRKQAQRLVAADGWQAPPDGSWGSLATELARPREQVPHRVRSLLGLNHNASLTAQYKTGKTNLLLDMAGALADGRPFLGRFDVTTPEGGFIGFWNGEMDADDFVDYARPLDIGNPDNIAVLNLRGYKMPLLTDRGRQWAIEWLKWHHIKVWLNDSWARLCAGSGIDENDNGAVHQLCLAIDEIKQAAGVANFVTTVHTPRAQQEPGTERSRGAAALDEWVDSRMVMTREGDDRFLFCEGRKVGLPETKLIYDPDTHISRAGEGTRSDARNSKGADLAYEAALAKPGLNKTKLLAAVRDLLPNGNQGDADKAIRAGIRQGLVYTTPGAKNSVLHWPKGHHGDDDN